MRLDKWLKVSRLIKRRTVANEACDNERISANGRVVKASYEVKVGDQLEIRFGARTVRLEVLSVTEPKGWSWTRQACSTVSFREAGQPRQCIPMSMNAGAVSGAMSRISPTMVSLVMVAIMTSSILCFGEDSMPQKGIFPLFLFYQKRGTHPLRQFPLLCFVSAGSLLSQASSPSSPSSAARASLSRARMDRETFLRS